MQSEAVIFTGRETVELAAVTPARPGPADIVVETAVCGISTGTEKLLWSGRMPPFPGLGYPLVPGYESVGEVVEAGADTAFRPGETVFVPGANGYDEARGLFGGTASRTVLPAARAVRIDRALGADAALLALAATAHHAVAERLPELIVGHGTLGRLMARLSFAMGSDCTVWEADPARRDGARGYAVTHADADGRRDYAAIADATGDAALLPDLIDRLAKSGEIVLAGFYADPIRFDFPPAFMREARLRVAAEWTRDDMDAVLRLVSDGRLDLSGLITHRRPAADAPAAYRTAFGDPACLKMLLDWKDAA